MAKDAKPRAIKLAEYTPPDYLIDTTILSFEIQPGKTQVTSTLSLRRNPTALSATGPLILHGQGLHLCSISVDDEALESAEYVLGQDTLTILDPKPAFHLRTVTEIVPEDNTALEGLYKSGSMYCTQCEAEGFRKITYYLDRPDVMAIFTTTIIGDGKALPTMLANGNEISRETLNDGRTKVTWHDPFPKPAYLFALVAGNLEHIEDSFTTMSGRTVVLRIFTEPHNVDKVDFAMDSLKRSMRWDEEQYGREYDLDIFMVVAVDDFNMGAMENKGLNIFNTSCVLATKETTTDAGHARVEAVVAHEYFHNWSGNRVTCRDWFQLSLKEGFTVFRDAQFSADQNSPTIKRVEDVALLRTRQFAEDAGPLAHPVRPDSYIEISNFYTATVYEKGAEVVGMLHTLLGPKRFRKATDLYFERHDGQAVTCDDFVNAMESASGIDLSTFRRWYSQAGTPSLRVRSSYCKDQKRLDLSIEQSCPTTPGQPDKQPFHIPLALGFLAPTGQEMLGCAGEKAGYAITTVSDSLIENPKADGTLIVHCKNEENLVTFENVIVEPVLSLLRGFSAPVKLDTERSREHLAFLVQNDSDGFARWDAAQQLYSEAILEAIGAGKGLPSVVGETFASLLNLAEGAADDGDEKALLAAMLALPSLEYLAGQMDVVLVDELHQAREDALIALAKQFQAQWLGIYRANIAPQTYRFDAKSVARRSLKNLALKYCSLAGQEGLELSVAQYRNTDNMSDRLAALTNVVWSGDADAEGTQEKLLGDFYERYKDDTLVVNQWFAIQAQAPQAGTLEKVIELVSHPAFDPRNPNKIMALVGSFCQRNAKRFHARDGSGYEFAADWVIRLNAQNPSIAARAVQPLTRYRRYDQQRQKLIRAQLERILASGDLSTDVFEVVQKSLTS